MSKITLSLIAALLFSASAVANTTYTYTGPAFTGTADYIVVNFTTRVPLLPSTSYITTASANVVSGSLVVIGPTVPAGFSLPLSTFQVHTDKNGAIDSWDILGNGINYTTDPVTGLMNGTFFQAYTMNTLAFIPGSDIPGAVGLVTGNYDYEQATETTYYTSCSTAPAGCTLAGNLQPYISNWSAIINPSNSSAASWVATTTPTTSPPVVQPIVVSGVLSGGQVGIPYSANLSATGGTPPYTWSESGLPAGLLINAATGAISGTPTTPTTNTVAVTVTDKTGASGALSASVIIAPQTVSCTAPSGSGVNNDADGQGTITAVNGNVITYKSSKGAAMTVNVPGCAKVNWNGTTAFAVGQQIEWVGYSSSTTGNVAHSVSVRSATNSCN